MKPLALILLVAATLPSQARAQSVPEGWSWHLDRPATNVMAQEVPAGSWRFQEMRPGIHVTTGPGVLLLAPGSASGRYMVDAEMLLFPDSRDVPYGVVVGARAAAQAQSQPADSWIGFLVSWDGKFQILRHTQQQAREIVPWQAHEAIVAKSKGVITNRLRVAVDRDSIWFSANGTSVAAIARGDLEVDGRYGVRLDEGVNMHITNVDLVTRLLKR